MNRGTRHWVALAMCVAAFAACQNPSARSPSAQTSVSSEERTKKNVRKLRGTLPGKPMKVVVDTLGQPSNVFTLENREIWDYKDAAYDPVTNQTVRSLQIFFVNRQVDSVNFSY